MHLDLSQEFQLPLIEYRPTTTAVRYNYQSELPLNINNNLGPGEAIKHCLSLHMNFACQAKCFTVWPRPKALPLKAKNVFEIFKNNAKQNSAFKQCFVMWPNVQTLLHKQISNVLQTMFDCLSNI